MTDLTPQLPDMDNDTLSFTAKMVANVLRNDKLDFSREATADLLEECANRLVEPDD